VSAYRKRALRPQNELINSDEDIFESIASNIDIEKELIRKEDGKSIRKAVDLLPDKYKDILILKFFEGQNYDSISDILQIPPGTVATRINRGKKQLKEILQKDYE